MTTTVIDFGYAAHLEELQDLVENLTGAAAASHEELNGDKHFDPSIIQFAGMQIKVVLEANALSDGSFTHDLRFYFSAL